MTTLVILCALVSGFSAMMIGIRNQNKSLIVVSIVPFIVGIVQIVMLFI